MNAQESRAEHEHWRAIKGQIAAAINERLEQIDAAVKELSDHLANCKQCQATEAPFKLCGTGNRLFLAAINA